MFDFIIFLIALTAISA